MATTFEAAHSSDILGTITTVDRLIIHGHMRAFWCHGAFARFLIRQGVHIMKGFAHYVQKATDKIKAQGERIAARAGRPFIYQQAVVKGKDDLARKIAKEDGVTQGLICVFSTMELATCFALVGGHIVPRLRKCLHLYYYVIDREFGFMHIRVQTWFPFQIQIYINGREWLARQLDRRGIAYERYENTFLWIDDLEAARKLCERLPRYQWLRILDAFAYRVNPLLPLLAGNGLGSYYWAIDACEVATDIMWKSRKSLLQIMGDLFDHAMRAFSADDVMRFLGRKLQPRVVELKTSHRRFPPHADDLGRWRPEARRIKHVIGHNWLKMYDKWSVLRIETVINRPTEFRILRFEKDRKGRFHARPVRMGKSILNLSRYLQIGEAANRRYLEALVDVKSTGPAVSELDALTRSHVVDGRRYAKLNPVSSQDCRVFEAVLAGEHAISGLRNRDIRARLYHSQPATPEEAKRRCARISRLLVKLRGHGLLAKVPGRRLYRVTHKGYRAMNAAVSFRRVAFPAALAA